MEMAGYLFELGYDLSLSGKYIASLSPGFEGCGLKRNDLVGKTERSERSWIPL